MAISGWLRTCSESGVGQGVCGLPNGGAVRMRLGARSKKLVLYHGNIRRECGSVGNYGDVWLWEMNEWDG